MDAARRSRPRPSRARPPRPTARAALGAARPARRSRPTSDRSRAALPGQPRSRHRHGTARTLIRDHAREAEALARQHHPRDARPQHKHDALRGSSIVAPRPPFGRSGAAAAPPPPTARRPQGVRSWSPNIVHPDQTRQRRQKTGHRRNARVGGPGHRPLVSRIHVRVVHLLPPASRRRTWSHGSALPRSACR